MISPRYLLTSAVVTALATVALSTGSVSAATTQQADPTDQRPRVERACARVPNLQIRTDKLIERINGDADTRGSLEWIDGRIAEAEANGREQLVEVLTNRRAARAASLPVLEQRKVALATIAERCANLTAGS